VYVRLLLEKRTIHRYQIDWAPTYEAGLAALGKKPYDVALVDYRLGGYTGVEWLRKAAAAGHRLPIILLTGADSLEIDQEAAASGAADYLCKVQLDTVHLERSIRYALRHAEEMAARRRLEKQLLSISDEQQRRIGADLHDELGQHLTGIACLAAALRDNLKAKHAESAEKAHQIAAMINGTIELTRMLARGLCPVQIEQGGLHAALEDLAFRVQRMHGVTCWFENGGAPPTLDPAVALHLYRIAQEAVNNAVRHGSADRIAVKLEVGALPLRLIIEDNGRGFTPGARRPSPGLGLHLMEQRADIIGGTFTITPRSQGIRVECTFGPNLPISNEN
jgi:signal transduction histidine kinase